MGKLETMLMNKKFTVILDETGEELKRFCKRIAHRCQDPAYTWEDFYQKAALSMLELFRTYGGYRKPKFKYNAKLKKRVKLVDNSKLRKIKLQEYIHRGKWAIYDELDKINAQKRDKRRLQYDRQNNISYIQGN